MSDGSSPARPHLQVVCALIEEAGRVLVARRSLTQSLPLKWEFPGGKIEPDESRAEALIREIGEELTLGIEVGEALDPVNHDYPEFTVTLHPFRCRITSGQPHPREHAEIAWCVPGELRALDWAEADLPVVDAYLNLRGV